MTRKSKRLALLSDAEQYSLYGLPDFDHAQQLEYLSLSDTELALACRRSGLQAQIYCALQIGYFKAKHAFSRFTWSEAEDDVAFVLNRYFNDEVFEPKAITKHEHYAQRSLIVELFGYRLWSAGFLPQLAQQAAQIVRRDVTPGFVVAELIVWLNEQKIVRPGYTTLQDLISKALSVERRRLGEHLSVKPASKLALRWEVVDALAERIRRHLRPLYGALDFSGAMAGNPWLKALAWVNGVFTKRQRLSQRPFAECPQATLPKRLRSYLLTFDADGKPTGLHAERYEFWLYRQIRKRLKSGELYLDDSL
jgi:hypothetical protein